MSDFGMQMPGGRGARRPSPDVYTALLAVASVALLTAVVFVYLGAAKVGKGGSAFGLQDAQRIDLAE